MKKNGKNQFWVHEIDFCLIVFLQNWSTASRVSRRVSRIAKQQIDCWDVPVAGGKVVTRSLVSEILFSDLPIRGKNCVECWRVCVCGGVQQTEGTRDGQAFLDKQFFLCHSWVRRRERNFERIRIKRIKNRKWGGNNEKAIIKSRVRISCISQSSTLFPEEKLQAWLAIVMSGNKKVMMTGPRGGRVEAGIKDVLEWWDALKGIKLIIRFLSLSLSLSPSFSVPLTLTKWKGSDQREAVTCLAGRLSTQEGTWGW